MMFEAVGRPHNYVAKHVDKAAITIPAGSLVACDLNKSFDASVVEA